MAEPSAAADAVALIPAAGGGVRLGQGPKAFLSICGRSMVQHVVDLVRQRVGRVLVAVPADHVEMANAQLAGLAEVHAGGATRLATIAGLLEKTTGSLVVVHDAARPFASLEALTQVIEAARTHGAAAACRKLKVPIACIENDLATKVIGPSQGASVESPLAFQRAILDRAFAYSREHAIQDEPLSDLVIRQGTPLRVVFDHDWNFKITTPLDWEIATKVVGPMLWEKKHPTSNIQHPTSNPTEPRAKTQRGKWP